MGTLYTSTPDTLSNFICQSIVSIIKNNLQEIEEDVEKMVFSILSSCKVLQIRFDYHWRQVMNTCKRNVMDLFSSMLGYTATSATSGKSAGEEFYAPVWQRRHWNTPYYKKLSSVLM